MRVPAKSLAMSPLLPWLTLAAGTAERLVQDRNQVAHFVARQRVVNVLAVTPGLDQPIGAKSRKLLRHRWLAQPEHALDLAHRLLAVHQKAQDQEPHLVRQRF